jgi:hypothetical protein
MAKNIQEIANKIEGIVDRTRESNKLGGRMVLRFASLSIR